MSYYRKRSTGRAQSGVHTWESAVAGGYGAGVTWPVTHVAGVADVITLLASLGTLFAAAPGVVPTADLQAWLRQTQPAAAAALRLRHDPSCVKYFASYVNGLVVMLLGMSQDLDQFRRLWATIGECSSLLIRETVPEHSQVEYYRRLATAIEQATLVQVASSMGPLVLGPVASPTHTAGSHVPTLLAPGVRSFGGLASGGGPAGGGGGSGGGGGGGSWYDNAIDGAKKGATVGMVAGPGGALWGAALGAAAGSLGITNPNASTGEDALKLLERAKSIYDSYGGDQAQVPESQRPTQTGTIGGQIVDEPPSLLPSSITPTGRR